MNGRILKAYNALGVVTKDRRILAFLEANDPQALRQCREAMIALEEEERDGSQC